MILIAEDIPAANARPDCYEGPNQRSVGLGLHRMDFRHALARPDLAVHRSRLLVPRRGDDPQSPEWATV